MSSEGHSTRSSDRGTTSALGDLIVILDTAVSLQPDIESVVEACLTPGPKGAALTRRAARLTSILIPLMGRADALPGCVIVDEARGLLRYHHRVLAESVDFAYSVTAIMRGESPSQFFSDRNLGEPAVRLRRLRQLVVRYVEGERHDSIDPAWFDVSARPGPSSHSLRTPLTTILGNASSLLQSDLDWNRDSGGRLLREIVAQSSRLSRAIDNVLQLASMSAGTMRPQFDWCDPASLAASVVARIDPALPGDRVVVAVDGITVAGSMIWADHALLTQAVGNIVDNALRHNPNGTRVELAVAAGADHLVVSVSDDGGGLPPGVAAVVARTRATGGTPTEIGTGIPATIGLVAAQGGTVSFPATGVGTQCMIRLPIEVDRSRV